MVLWVLKLPAVGGAAMHAQADSGCVREPLRFGFVLGFGLLLGLLG